MSDFDFDEIDKAVAGALGGSDEPSLPADELLPSSSRETVAPEKVPPVEPKKHEDEPVKPRTSLASRRGAGRFMDVMHPSSDMRVRQTASSPKPMAPTPTEELSEQGQDSYEQDEAPRRGGLHSAAVHSSAPMSAHISSHHEEVEEGEGDNTQGAVSPLASPFLTDAKIEKRPLGSAAPTGAFTAPTVEEELDFDDFESTATTLPIANDDQETPLLLEAAEDFFLESGEEELTQQPGELAVEPGALESEHDTSVQKSEPTPAPTVDEAVPTGPTSIKQQYEERPTESGESGAIYDTENYHQPVTYPEKKRAGAWTILWISLLIIFGAGVGVAFYLFVLPTL